AMTLGQLAFPLRSLDAQEINHLPLGDMETKTKLIIEFHAVRSIAAPFGVRAAPSRPRQCSRRRRRAKQIRYGPRRRAAPESEAALRPEYAAKTPGQFPCRCHQTS